MRVPRTIDPVWPADQAFHELAALFDDYRVHYGRPSSPAVTRAWLVDQLTHRRLTVAAAFDEDRVFGFITIMVMPASLMLGAAWSIRDLFVAEQYRRRGIAQALVQYAIAEARAAGATRVSLQTETANAPALALYAAAGFQPVTGLELLSLNLDKLGDP